jgi:4-amino-4-deoxy-L-arabinose transferase-like glycosyltransferase
VTAPAARRWPVPALALVVRLAFFLAVRPWDPAVEHRSVLVYDSIGYHEQAITILQAHRLARSPLATPDAITAPIYPLFVAACYRAFGQRPWVVLLVQCLIDSLSALLLVACMSRWFGAPTGFVTGLLYALEPFPILYCSMLLTDILFVFTLVATLNALSRAVGRGAEARWAWVGLGAAGMGVATLIRPAGQFLPVVLLLALALEHRRRPARLARWATASLAVFALVVSPWLIRNARVFGHVFLTTSGSYNLLALGVAPMLAEERNVDWGRTQRELNQEADDLLAAEGRRPEELDAYQRSTYWRRVALRYIAREPARFAACWAKGMAHTFLNLDTSVFALVLGRAPHPVELKTSGLWAKVVQFGRTKGPFGLLLGAWLALWLLVCYGAAAVGLAQAWGGPSRIAALLLVMLIFYFAAVAGAGGLARFKLPAIPCYLPFTAAGVRACLAWARPGARRS